MLIYIERLLELWVGNSSNLPYTILAYPDAAKRPFYHLANHYLQIASSPLARKPEIFWLSLSFDNKTPIRFKLSPSEQGYLLFN